MQLRSLLGRLVLAVPFVLAPLSGCRTTTSASPELSSEAQRLEMLVGRWVAIQELTASDSGETFPAEVTVDARWDLSGTVVAARSAVQWTDPEDGKPRALESYTYYSWDAATGTYRTQRFDSAGNVAEGTMTYDEEANMWHLEDTLTETSTGLRTRGTGTLQYIAEDEQIVEWRSSPERGGGGFRMVGRSQRVSR